MDKEYIGVRIKEFGDGCLNLMNILIVKSSTILMIYFRSSNIFKVLIKIYVLILSLFLKDYKEIYNNIVFLEKNIRTYTVFSIIDAKLLNYAFKEKYIDIYKEFSIDLIELTNESNLDLFNFSMVQRYMFKNIIYPLFTDKYKNIESKLSSIYSKISNPKEITINELVYFWFTISFRKKKFLDIIVKYSERCNVDASSLYHKYEGHDYTIYENN